MAYLNELVQLKIITSEQNTKKYISYNGQVYELVNDILDIVRP